MHTGGDQQERLADLPARGLHDLPRGAPPGRSILLALMSRKGLQGEGQGVEHHQHEGNAYKRSQGFTTPSWGTWRGLLGRGGREGAHGPGPMQRQRHPRIEGVGRARPAGPPQDPGRLDEQGPLERYRQIQKRVQPEINARIAENSEAIARRLTEVEWALVDQLEKDLPNMTGTQAATALQRATWSKGVNIDKSRLYRNEPTEIKKTDPREFSSEAPPAGYQVRPRPARGRAGEVRGTRSDQPGGPPSDRGDHRGERGRQCVGRRPTRRSTGLP